MVQLGLESPTHSIVDKSLGCLPTILAVLDFSTTKNELFPVIAAVFSRTSSLGIKIRGLEAFVVLCGGSAHENAEFGDDLNGSLSTPRPTKPTILDKYTVQEKIVPLMKAMKTKEPAVMMAALAVFKQVGQIADIEFLAMDVLPILWSFSLGPLLNLDQFQEFMSLIKSLSSRIEQEQTRKLRDLSSSAASGLTNASRSNDLMNMGPINSLFGTNGAEDVGQNDFERLVLGKGAVNGTNSNSTGNSYRPPLERAQSSQTHVPAFSWSTPVMSPTSSQNIASAAYSNPGSRAITPDQSLNSFAALKPMSGGTGVPSQLGLNGMSAFVPMQPTSPVNPWSTTSSASPQTSTFQTAPPQASFSMASPNQTTNGFAKFSLAPPPSQAQRTNNPTQYGGNNLSGGISQIPPSSMQPPQKKGLDAYESLL